MKVYSPSRKRIWNTSHLILLFTLLIFGGNSVNAVKEDGATTTTFEECRMDMVTADDSTDESLTKQEYVSFIQALEKSPKYADINAFEQLPEPLRNNFNNYAFSDEMNIIGADEADPLEDDIKILQEICNATVELLSTELPTVPEKQDNIFANNQVNVTVAPTKPEGDAVSVVTDPGSEEDDNDDDQVIGIISDPVNVTVAPTKPEGDAVSVVTDPGSEEDDDDDDQVIGIISDPVNVTVAPESEEDDDDDDQVIGIISKPDSEEDAVSAITDPKLPETSDLIVPNATMNVDTNTTDETGANDTETTNTGETNIDQPKDNTNTDNNEPGDRRTITTKFTVLRDLKIDDNDHTMITNGFKQFVADFIIRIAQSGRVRKRSLIRGGGGKEVHNHRKLKVVVDASVAGTTLDPCPKFANTTSKFCYVATGAYDIIVVNEDLDYALEQYQDTTDNFISKGFLQNSLDKIHPDSVMTIVPEKEAKAILETQVVPVYTDFIVLSEKQKLADEDTALIKQAYENVVRKVVGKLNGVVATKETSSGTTGLETDSISSESNETINEPDPGSNGPETNEATETTGRLDEPAPSTWTDKKWIDLPDIIKDAAGRLGYNEFTWDENRGPNLMKSSYDALTEREKISAELLGYDQKTWDGAYYWNTHVYNELPLYLQQAAVILGYNQTTWDNGENTPAILTVYNQLTLQQQFVAIEFGFTEKKWNINSVNPFKVNRVSKSNNVTSGNTTEPLGVGTGAASDTQVAITEGNSTVGESNSSATGTMIGNRTVGENISIATGTTIGNSTVRLLMGKQRRLTVSLEPSTIDVGDFVPCPVANADGFCSSGIGKYKVIATENEDPQKVQDDYTNATKLEFENGTFQDEIDAINPNSGLTVKPAPKDFGTVMPQVTLPIEPQTPKSVAPTPKTVSPPNKQIMQGQQERGSGYHWGWLILAVFIGMLFGILLSFLVRLCCKKKKNSYDPENPYHANDNDRNKHSLLLNEHDPEDNTRNKNYNQTRPPTSDFESINPESFHDEIDVEDDKESIAERRSRYKGIIKPILQEYFPEKLDELEKELKSSEGHEKDVLINYKNEASKAQKKKYHEMVTELVERYFPNENLKVDSFMRKWDGREEELIAALKYKARGIKEKIRIGDELNEEDIGLNDLEKIADKHGNDVDEMDDSFNRDLNQGIAHKRALSDDSESNKGTGNYFVEKFLEESDSERTEQTTPQTQAVRDEIKDIVQKDHPEWVDDMDRMMDEYRGREIELLNAVKLKSEEKGRAKYRVKVEKLLEKHYPEKLNEIDEMMDEYEGREDELVKTLKLRGEATENLDDDSGFFGSNGSSDFDKSDDYQSLLK